MEIKTKEEALRTFKLLGIKDVSSRTQVKNGTTVYELPIKWMNSRGEGSAVKYATYESGYVRNVSPWNSTCWQINKRYESKEKFWSTHCKKYYSHNQYKRILIHSENDRLVYLANYILKNDYRKDNLHAVDVWTKECIVEADYELHHAGNALITRSEYAKLKRTQWEKDNGVFDTWGEHQIDFGYCLNSTKSTNKNSSDDIQVIINGHRYKLS